LGYPEAVFRTSTTAPPVSIGSSRSTTKSVRLNTG